ncbi:patatin-like protein [Aerophototrophica crusticola]|uniref:Patatin-like protein n=1 Tax=Aerophototrophica crusticola TaxID=1709002 RepID=A0A858RAL6_9PROT|nr:patatin-like protein [Rhodospirillaceae bacterium B3]
MKEKELRVALVCYGGVSLAVYMHGVTKEVWKLARASRACHDRRPTAAPVEDSEGVYLDLLRRLGRDLSLRVVVDVVAGSSAGGINGVLLARALAHDLSLEPLTRLWLENADVTRLLGDDRRAGKWSKWFLRPFLWAGLPRLERLAPDPEVREKLSLFVRSRWFQPPFDGDRLMAFLLEAAYAMGPADDGPEGPSLLPRGLPLTLFVTATDFHGYRTRIPAHDPPLVEEREHRHIFAFRYRRAAEGPVESDFTDANVPGLVFAARATSSFPGAFPPARLPQMDRLLEDQGLDWPDRDRFLAGNFQPYLAAGASPAQACFIDGSVLNNKPFAAALAAIAGRPAYREVDRRVVYVDPNPAGPTGPGRADVPGFFRTLKGALSDIPRNEPTRDALGAIADANRRVERLQGVLDAARPRIADQVAAIVGGPLPDAPGMEQVRRWREGASRRAAAQAGFAFEAYIRLKIEGVLEELSGLLSTLSGHPDPAGRAALLAALKGWARARGILPDRLDAPEPGGPAPAWVGFLQGFDIGFRERRLRFLIRELNLLYEAVGTGALADTRPHDLDELKVAFYGSLEGLRRARALETLSAEDRPALAALLSAAAIPGPADLDGALGILERAWALEGSSREVDEVFALMGLNYLGLAARQQLFEAYLGFAFWDVLTFSTSGWQELDEFHAIKVDRIAPPDARLLREAGAPQQMRSARLNAFGGFFSRTDREHDYVLGRLHAAERVIDLVLDSAGNPLPPAEVRAAKLSAFHAILDAERQRLGSGSAGLCQAEAWVERCQVP